MDNRYGIGFETSESFDYCVYAHICKAIGDDYDKIYIGVTNNIKSRWRLNGRDYRSGTALSKAFKKYGWDNFEHIVLIENITASMADTLERELIKKYNTNYKKGGYGFNANDGGISYRKRNIPIHQYDIKGVYVQTFDSISEAAKTVGCTVSRINGCLNDDHYAAFYLWNTEYVPLMDSHPNNIKSYIDFPILQVDNNGLIIKRYENIYEITGFNRYNIIKTCKGEYSRSQGYTWFYESDYSPDNFIKRFKYDNIEKNLNNNKTIDFSIPPRSVEVDAYDSKLNYVGTFSSSASAGRYFNIDRSLILNCCKNPNRFIDDYIFVYHGEPVPKLDYPTKYKYIAIDKRNHEVFKIFDSRSEILNFIGNKNFGKINEVCAGKRRTIYGYIWRKIDENGNIIEPS